MRKVFLGLVVLFFLASFGFAQEEKISVSDVKIEDKDAPTLREEFSFYKEDLIGGRINIKGKAKSKEASISKVEVSTDGGRTWEEAEGTENWQFRFYPDEGLHKIKFLVSDTKGNMSTIGDLRITYTKFKPEEAILKLLDKMGEAYTEESLQKFTSCFSEGHYPNYIKFREAIQRDFQYFRNIRTFKRIESYNISEDENEAFYDVLWKSKYTDTRDNSKASRSSLISMYLIKDQGLWKVASLKNNNLFGTTILANIDLTLSSSDISSSGQVPSVTITASISNTGDEEARNVKVKFYYKPAGGSYTSFAEETITRISPRGSASTSATFTQPSGNYTIKVVADPDNTIVEKNETNNSATRDISI